MKFDLGKIYSCTIMYHENLNTYQTQRYNLQRMWVGYNSFSTCITYLYVMLNQHSLPFEFSSCPVRTMKAEPEIALSWRSGSAVRMSLIKVCNNMFVNNVLEILYFLDYTLHLIPKWPKFSTLLFSCKLALVALFLNSKFKRVFSLKRGNKG